MGEKTSSPLFKSEIGLSRLQNPTSDRHMFLIRYQKCANSAALERSLQWFSNHIQNYLLLVLS